MTNQTEITDWVYEASALLSSVNVIVCALDLAECAMKYPITRFAAKFALAVCVSTVVNELRWHRNMGRSVTWLQRIERTEGGGEDRAEGEGDRPTERTKGGGENEDPED